MKYNRTTFVLGAGASKAIEPEFGLGIELVKQIQERLTDSVLLNTLKRDNIEIDVIQRLAKILGEYNEVTEAPSIDQFVNKIDNSPEFSDSKIEFTKIIRKAITYHILGYEGRLKTRLENSDYSYYQNSWLVNLIDFMRLNDFFQSKVFFHKLKFVVFNYDRTLEFILLREFKSQTESVLEFIKKSVVHPYGLISNLNNSTDSELTVEYGAMNNVPNNLVDKNYLLQYDLRKEKTNQLINSQLFISTLADRKVVKSDQIIYDQALDQQVCFFGFSFDHLNCKLLNLKTRNQNKPTYFANIHPIKHDPGFISQIKFTNKLLQIRTDFKITYEQSGEFIQSRLENFDLTEK